MEQTKRRPGRPAIERRRIQMAMRVTPELRDELIARAAAKGRSITQEMELLLETGLLVEKLIGSGLIEVMQAFDRAGSELADKTGVEGDWTRDPDAYLVAGNAAVARLLRLAPEPWNFRHWLGVFESTLANAHLRRTGVWPPSGTNEEERQPTDEQGSKP